MIIHHRPGASINNKEFKLHIYGKRQIQVENFSLIENEQIKLKDKKLCEITNLCVEIMNNK